MAQDRIQVVDENDVPIGTTTKDSAQKHGLIHRIVKVLVEDGEGRVLLQKRTAHVLSPNCWDSSAAGHVDAGEGYETAAKRELREELGVGDVELEETGYYRRRKEVDGKKLNRFYKTFRVVLVRDYPFKLQAEEVDEVRWFTREEVVRLVRERPQDFTDGMRQLAKTWDEDYIH